MANNNGLRSQLRAASKTRYPRLTTVIMLLILFLFSFAGEILFLSVLRPARKIAALPGLQRHFAMWLASRCFSFWRTRGVLARDEPPSFPSAFLASCSSIVWAVFMLANLLRAS